jgi:hypothetical protein
MAYFERAFHRHFGDAERGHGMMNTSEIAMLHHPFPDLR